MQILKKFRRKQINKSNEITYNDRLFIYSNFKIKQKSTGRVFNTSEQAPLDISESMLDDFEETNELVEVVDEIS